MEEVASPVGSSSPAAGSSVETAVVTAVTAEPAQGAAIDSSSGRSRSLRATTLHIQSHLISALLFSNPNCRVLSLPSRRSFGAARSPPRPLCAPLRVLPLREAAAPRGRRWEYWGRGGEDWGGRCQQYNARQYSGGTSLSLVPAACGGDPGSVLIRPAGSR